MITAWSAFISKDNKMYLASFVITFTFHSRLEIDRIIIKRSFSHPFEKLTDISYLTSGILENFDQIKSEQLCNWAVNVSRKKGKFAI